MVETTSDPSKKLRWYFRINRDGLKTFLIFDNAGVAKVLTGYVPVINFKRRENDSTAFLTLSIGSGITSVAGGWSVALTKVQAATFREMTYFVELVITQGGLERNWISGDAVFHNGRFDGVTTDSSTLTVYDDGGTVSISITESGSGGGGTWGTITGTLPDQTDLQTALDAKVPTARTVNLQALSANIVLPNLIYYNKIGNYITNNSLIGAADGNIALTANQLRATPLIITQPITITEITFNCTGLVGGSTARIGIYVDNGSNPVGGAIVAGSDVGTYDTASTGVKSSGAISIALTPGLYWIAINASAAITVRGWTNFMPAVMGITTTGTGTPANTGYTVSLTYGAMPATFTAGAIEFSGSALKIGLKI